MRFLLLILLFLSGCVHTNPPVASTSDQYLAKAAVISDRLDAKAVVVTEWLKSH